MTSLGTTQSDPLAALGGVSLDDLVRRSAETSPYEARQKAIADKATKVLDEQQADPRLKQLRDDETAAAQKAADRADEKYKDIQPLKVEEWKQKPPENDPIQSFGSLGGAFAMIASAFTHQPMVNALNAGAAAMNAYRQNDLAKYEEARRAWKDNMELALKRHEQQSLDFKDALELGKTDITARDAALQAYSAKYGDQIAALKTEAGMVGDLDKIWQSRQQTAERLAQLYPALDKESERRALLLADPDWLSNDPQRKAAALRRATQAMSQFSVSSIGTPQEVVTTDGTKHLAQQDRTTGQWVTADESRTPIEGVVRVLTTSERGDQFTPDMGALMGALAERGISLPTGFRSKQQQVELYKGLLARNPGKTPDQIADEIKSGQIQFGAEKKETQVAAGQAGKIQVAANEIAENIPYLRELSAKVPRGKFIPISRLLQTADSNLSDPNLKQLKIGIISMLNAYDALAARGGTDVQKREEVDRLLTSADGPEAFDAALRGFEREAGIAKNAAREATKVPTAAGPKEGDTDKSKSGRPIIFRNGQWEYQ